MASVRAVIVTSTRRFAGSLRTATTFAQHHAHIPVTIAVVDDRYRRCGGVEGAGFEGASLDLRTLDVRAVVNHQLGAGEYERLVALYAADELVDLLRPVVMREVLTPEAAPGAAPDGLGASVVLSIPDDAEIVGPLTDFIGLAGSAFAASVVRRTPLPRDGRVPDEVDLTTTGWVDHQFFAVGLGGVPVLDWWIERSQRHPFVEPARMQTHLVPWLDQAKRMFPDTVVEVTGQVRSYLNADESGPGSSAVLRFPDFDPERPWIASPRGGEWPRVTISAHMDLRLAAKARSAAMLGPELGHLSTSIDGEPYDHLSLGYPYDTVMRALYSGALHAAERNRAEPPPNPFGEPDAFVSWLREDVEPGLSRYLQRAREMTEDLRTSFQDDNGALLEWARSSGPGRGFSPSLTGVLPSALAADRDEHTPTPREAQGVLTPGVNLVGLFKAEMGIGEAARLTRQAVQRSAVPYSLVLDDGTAHRQNDPFDIGTATGFRHDVNVVVANADALPSVVARLDRPASGFDSVFGDLPTIGLWFWELAEFPPSYDAAFRHVDEVWVASEHVRHAIAPAAAEHGVPVHVIPLGASVPPAPIPADEVAARGVAIGIPADRFCFLFSFDHRSIAERKNPWGLVEAFTKAFPNASSTGPVLVIKTISGEVDLLGRERLRWMAASRSDVILIEGFLDLADRQALLQRCNAYISLHRAEGWGLTMAEAMAYGIPTVATGYSGNLEFMNETNSWLVDYSLVPIPRKVAHYGGLGSWAEPDLAQAAELMKRIIDDPDERDRRAHQGMLDVQAMAKSDAGGRFVIERLREVRRIDTGARRANMRARLHLKPDREQDSV